MCSGSSAIRPHAGSEGNETLMCLVPHNIDRYDVYGSGVLGLGLRGLVRLVLGLFRIRLREL